MKVVIQQKPKVRVKRPNPNRKIEVPSSYHWKLLGALTFDLKGYLSADDLYILHKIIRDKDFQSYLRLKSDWGLQSMSPEYTGELLQKHKARYVISSLFKKYLFDTDDTSEQDAVAIKKFLQFEKHCKFYNAFGINHLLNGKDEFTVDLLTYARSFLKKLLGETVPVKDVIELAQHGPGANLDTVLGSTSVFDKTMNLPYSCTRACLGYATFMIQSDQRWFRALVDEFRRTNSLNSEEKIDVVRFWDQIIKVVDHNRICSVPKNAETSRTIAIEPTLNVMLQLGVDKVMKSRLKRWGINLSDQSINRQLARIGSISGCFCTLDLKGASDTSTLKICEALLPPEWYSFLIALRSPKGSLGGKTFSYEKISSMGNGYTFALESALFAAVIYAVYKINKDKVNFGENASVFGDDLIVKSEYYQDLTQALELSGFMLNPEKSFSKGSVRESCGADWFKGAPVRPILFSNPPKTVMELYVHHNSLKRMLELRFGMKNTQVVQTILKWIPNDLQYWGPCSDQVFDSWLHSERAPLVSKSGLYSFTRLLSFPAKRTFTKAESYGRWFFQLLTHDLKGVDKEPFYKKFKSVKGSGNRFVVIDKVYTTRQQSSVTDFWSTGYQDLDLSRFYGR